MAKGSGSGGRAGSFGRVSRSGKWTAKAPRTAQMLTKAINEHRALGTRVADLKVYSTSKQLNAAGRRQARNELARIMPRYETVGRRAALLRSAFGA